MADLPEPTPVDELEGGKAAFRSALSNAIVGAVVGQLRLTEFLDHVGDMGEMRWDPISRELEMRGHVFQAEMIGSCAAGTWLWSWGNPYLNLPDSSTTVSRAFRDQIECPVGRTAFLSIGSLSAHDFGSLLTGNGLASAYYVCDTSPTSQAVYAIVDPVSAEWPLLYEIHRAFTTALPLNVVEDLPSAIVAAAEMLGTQVERNGNQIRITHGKDWLQCVLDDQGHLVSSSSDIAL